MSKAFEEFVDALLTLERTQLASMLATIECLTFTAVASTQVRKGIGGFFSGAASKLGLQETSEFFKESFGLSIDLSHKIEQTAFQYQNTMDKEELADAIINGFSYRLGIEEPSASEWYHKLLEEVSQEFGVKSNGFPDEFLVNHLFEAILQDNLKSLQHQIANLTLEQEQEILASLGKSLQNLSPEERRAIMEASGIEQLSGKALLQAFKSGGLLAGGLLGANAAGFGLYLAATTITHAIFTTLLGITLSFGFYTTLTSAIAFLLNPVVGVLLVSGVGGATLRGQGQGFARRVSGMVLFPILGQIIHEKERLEALSKRLEILKDLCEDCIALKPKLTKLHQGFDRLNKML